MRAFVKTNKKTSSLLAAEFSGRTLWDIFGDEVRAALGEFDILAEGQKPAPHADRAIYLDSRYCLLGRDTIRAALRYAQHNDAPLQVAFESETHPVKTMESVCRIQGPIEVLDNCYNGMIARDDVTTEEIWWVFVTALGEEGVMGFGCRDFTIPPKATESLCVKRVAPIVRPEWGAAEIPLDLRVNVASNASARFDATWPAVCGARSYEIALYRTVDGEGDWYKGFTAPGVAHFDMRNGRLVRPADGAYLRNRQALPRLCQRCSAIVIGTAEEAARLEQGEFLPGALVFALPRDEALCVGDEIDVLRCEVALERMAGKKFAGAQAI